ncbi:MAG: serine/threonine protein kinase, partial [Polyangiaceae bacterium]|nr:serine/threonine protein kinase [Polyangiaceae bacterium]
MQADSALERVPDRIGKYRLIAKLGEGGMASVYLAVAHGPIGFSKLSVLKVARPHLADDPEILQMFLEEARLAGRLNHANVVQTYEV